MARSLQVWERIPLKVRQAEAPADGAARSGSLTRPESVENDRTDTVRSSASWLKEEIFEGPKEAEKTGSGGLDSGTFNTWSVARSLPVVQQ